MRSVLPAYPFPVPGFEPGWMEQYRENWALLRESMATALPGA